MSSYAELRAQIAELEKQANALKKTEIAGAKRRISEIMRGYGLTLADLSMVDKPTPAKVKQPVAIKYKDPRSGATWTGRGRAPLWLNGKNKDDFLV